MARIEGSCKCERTGCSCEFDQDTKWVDAVTGTCRACEIEHGERWGHNTAKAEEATQSPGERVL